MDGEGSEEAAHGHGQEEEGEGMEEAPCSSSSSSGSAPAGAYGYASAPSASLPAPVCGFVEKLWKMVTQTDESILRWGADGTKVEVLDPEQLEESVLPRYFRHGRFSSLVRQLIFYSFQRIKGEQKYTYMHPHFQRDKPEELRLIRKKPSPPPSSATLDPVPLFSSVSEFSIRIQKHITSNFLQQRSKALVPEGRGLNLNELGRHQPRNSPDLAAPIVSDQCDADPKHTNQRAGLSNPTDLPGYMQFSYHSHDMFHTPYEQHWRPWANPAPTFMEYTHYPNYEPHHPPQFEIVKELGGIVPSHDFPSNHPPRVNYKRNYDCSEQDNTKDLQKSPVGWGSFFPHIPVHPVSPCKRSRNTQGNQLANSLHTDERDSSATRKSRTTQIAKRNPFFDRDFQPSSCPTERKRQKIADNNIEPMGDTDAADEKLAASILLEISRSII